MQQQQQQIILLQSIINNKKLLSCVIKRECEVKKKLLTVSNSVDAKKSVRLPGIVPLTQFK